MIGCLLRQAALRPPGVPDEIKSSFNVSKQEGGQGYFLPEGRMFAGNSTSISPREPISYTSRLIREIS